MGQYGYAFDKLINQEYTTEVFLSDLNNSYLAAENAIDSMYFVSTIVNEEETGLSASDDIIEQDSNVEETKLKLKDKLKEMLAKFLKWFKSIWDKLADTVKKAIEVVRDNTIQDKIMAKLFDDLSYSDVEKAIEAGWKGLNYKTTACPDPVTMNDSTIKKRISKTVQKPHDLAGQIDKILYVNSADEAKEIYEDVSSQCKKFLSRYETQKNDPSQQMRYGEIERITRRAFSFLNDDGGSFGSVFFTYLSIKNPNAEGYGFPNKQQFDDIKLMAIGGQRYCVVLRKEYYNNHIKDLELFIDKDVENIFKNFSDPSLSKESNQIMKYYYKSMLASDRTQLILHNRICSEVVQMIHFQTKIGIRTYLKLLSAVKLFVMGKANMA